MDATARGRGGGLGPATLRGIVELGLGDAVTTHDEGTAVLWRGTSLEVLGDGYVSVYMPLTSGIVGARVGGASVGMESETEGGLSVASRFLEVLPGQSSTLNVATSGTWLASASSQHDCIGRSRFGKKTPSPHWR